MSEDVWTVNRRVIQHEIDTPMRGHDEDGACCLRARLTPLPDESQPAPPPSHGTGEAAGEGGL